ncbi:MAG: hypothetical protein FJ011_23715 [Chloroflexi bacterium]|nr:hypothetical protein [Chloroflexota bacterium]
MYMVMLVLDARGQLDAVLEAWRAIGVGGVTIAETTGAFRRLVKLGAVRARYILGGLAVSSGEDLNHTLWAIVPDEGVARECLEAAEAVVGDLDGPDTGVFAAWPLPLVKGAPRLTTRSQDAS